MNFQKKLHKFQRGELAGFISIVGGLSEEEEELYLRLEEFAQRKWEQRHSVY